MVDSPKFNSRITSIDDLMLYCFRRLGWPVINVEIERTQALERVYDGLQFYGEQHFNGFQEIWVKHVFTAKDEALQKIHLSRDISAVLEIYDPSVRGAGVSSDEFDRLNYLIANSDLFYLAQSGYSYQRDLKNYEITMSYIRLLQLYFTPVRDFTYNYSSGEMIVGSGKIVEGNYVMLRVYRMIDPEKSVGALNEMWVKDYTTALMKRQWGANLKKYEGVQMTGGITLNGQKIFEEAQEEIKDLQEKFISMNTLPFGPMWG